MTSTDEYVSTFSKSMKLEPIGARSGDSPESSPVKKQEPSTPPEWQTAPNRVVRHRSRRSNQIHTSQPHRPVRSGDLSLVKLANYWEHKLWTSLWYRVSEKLDTYAGEPSNENEAQFGTSQPSGVLEQLLTSMTSEQRLKLLTSHSVAHTSSAIGFITSVLLDASLLSIFCADLTDAVDQLSFIVTARTMVWGHDDESKWLAQDLPAHVLQVRGILRKQLLQRLHDTNSPMVRTQAYLRVPFKSKQVDSSVVKSQKPSDVKVEVKSEFLHKDWSKTAPHMVTRDVPSQDRTSVVLTINSSGIAKIETRAYTGRPPTSNEKSDYLHKEHEGLWDDSGNETDSEWGNKWLYPAPRSQADLEQLVKPSQLTVKPENSKTAQVLRSSARFVLGKHLVKSGSIQDSSKQPIPIQQRETEDSQQIIQGQVMEDQIDPDFASDYRMWHNHQTSGTAEVPNRSLAYTRYANGSPQSHLFGDHNVASGPRSSTVSISITKDGFDTSHEIERHTDLRDINIPMSVSDTESDTSSERTTDDLNDLDERFLDTEAARLRSWLLMRSRSEQFFRHLERQVEYRQHTLSTPRDQSTDTPSRSTSSSSSSSPYIPVSVPTTLTGGTSSGSKRRRDDADENDKQPEKKERLPRDKHEHISTPRLACFYNKYDPMTYRLNAQTGKKFEICETHDWQNMGKL
jgi:hypothetical protein